MDGLRARVSELEARNAHLEKVSMTMSSQLAWASQQVRDAVQRDRMYQEQIQLLEQRLGHCSGNSAVDSLSEISALGRRVVQSQLNETNRCLLQMEGFVKELEIRELSALGEIERVSAECVTLRDMNSIIVQTVRRTHLSASASHSSIRLHCAGSQVCVDPRGDPPRRSPCAGG
jgi:acetate kinase